MHYGGTTGRLSDRQQILSGRLFVALILAITYGLSLVTRTTIFAMGTWSFTGFAGLVPIIVAALFWRRSTKVGAWASVLHSGGACGPTSSSRASAFPGTRSAAPASCRWR